MLAIEEDQRTDFLGLREILTPYKDSIRKKAPLKVDGSVVIGREFNTQTKVA